MFPFFDSLSLSTGVSFNIGAKKKNTTHSTVHLTISKRWRLCACLEGKHFYDFIWTWCVWCWTCFLSLLLCYGQLSWGERSCCKTFSLKIYIYTRLCVLWIFLFFTGVDLLVIFCSFGGFVATAEKSAGIFLRRRGGQKFSFYMTCRKTRMLPFFSMARCVCVWGTYIAIISSGARWVAFTIDQSSSNRIPLRSSVKYYAHHSTV